ncbi:hypothetical protein PA7_43920 [Pseudonocardia asaccharolytica DSM 44247 = NBRC 16224]|uniref:Methyltransferase type 11 domain-containing protein n=1 Tax=Pseudonocardia asaccharolytica DSM 44247 = NBRC 16224 TaxID=1123024 RepID=A0A511D6Y2_9PSEU|nr:hypothetical protein PA7_43920 [Pseudonocardia asaccharolytica DSM 44247 = NBRC 16224]
MSMLQFDEDAARNIQRVYSTPDVVQQRAEVLALLAPRPGERILDVGSGPGFWWRRWPTPSGRAAPPRRVPGDRPVADSPVQPDP